MPYTVEGIPLAVISAWAEVQPSLAALPHGLARGMMFPYRLSKLVEVVSGRPLISVPHLTEEGRVQEQEDKLRLQIFQAQLASRKKKGQKGADRGAAQAHQNTLAAEAPARLRELERERDLAR